MPCDTLKHFPYNLNNLAKVQMHVHIIPSCLCRVMPDKSTVKTGTVDRYHPSMMDGMTAKMEQMSMIVVPVQFTTAMMVQ